ncbi:MAG: FkbM family methyltransferase [Acidiferrobacterales bacterium]|nr:FkbM family methyltransferase [Acidiferrobacterales bacterium]
MSKNRTVSDDWLVTHIPLEAKIEIVDIGASLLGGPSPYQPLLQRGLARVTGFEPNPEQFARLDQRQSETERYLPYALGDGAKRELHITHHRGFVSSLKPDPSIHQHFDSFAAATNVLKSLPMQTVKLSDIDEIQRIDLFKMDIQGGEMMVFENVGTKLQATLIVHTELALIPLYHNQPLIGDQMQILGQYGFLFYGFYDLHKYPLHTENNRLPVGQKSTDFGQVMDGDGIFLRDFRGMDKLTDQQLCRLSLIAHFVYRSASLTTRCLDLLERRRTVGEDAHLKYAALLVP